MARVFTREEFYELVWEKPLTQLAKEFALSDVALHKICKKHNIPHPPVGWWAKKAAGKAVRRAILPKSRADTPDNVTIAAGEVRAEPDLIAAARENARLAVTTIDEKAEGFADPIVDRTLAQLRKGKPSTTDGLVSIEGLNVIRAKVAPASVDRLALALKRLAAAITALGIRIDKGEKGAVFVSDGETVGFSIAETVKREKHVPTARELAEEEARQKRIKRHWNNPSRWNDEDVGFNWNLRPEWDYHPTGQIAFEFEHKYLLGTSPRRLFKDAKVQRLENMASDIAVGIAVMAAALKDDRLKREEEERKREEARRQRELLLRQKHIAERRSAALDEILEEVAALDRLRRLVSGLQSQPIEGAGERVGKFLELAERRLRAREKALSAEGLEKRFVDSKLFGEDDDHDFRAPYSYY